MEFKEPHKFEHHEDDSLQSEILGLLDRYDIKLDPDRKDQHILTSREVITQLVDSAELTPDDIVLEIGPGPGQITESIAKNAGQVYAIEIDERFSSVLDDLQKKYENLEVIFGSALDIKWPAVNKLVSNIMKLLRKDKRKSDFGLRLLVSRMVNTPNESVVGLLRDIINEKVNLRTMDYRSIPTVKSLNVPETTLRKSLRDLDNMDINVLARKIGSLKRKFR